MLEQTRYKYLVKEYKNHIYNFSNFILKNKMDADDVTQEVLIKIWKNLNDFKISSAKPWIMRTTYNLCIDYLRQRKRATVKEISIDKEEIREKELMQGSYNDPQDKTHFNMMNQKVNKAIENLPENLKNVFVLYQINELKYKEISKVLDMPINTVKVNILRARKKLQEELRDYETEK